MSQSLEYVPLPAMLPDLLEQAGQKLHRRRRFRGRPVGLEVSVDRIERAHAQHIVMPCDLLLGSWRALFPAERMMLLCGRAVGDITRVTSVRDVTGEGASRAYVKASPILLGRVLLDVEATGARVIGWLHSHPGSRPGATAPSAIDRRQDEDWHRDFGDAVIGLIATNDGYVRGFGHAIERGLVLLDFEGKGLQRGTEERHVYRLVVGQV